MAADFFEDLSQGVGRFEGGGRSMGRYVQHRGWADDLVAQLLDRLDDLRHRIGDGSAAVVVVVHERVAGIGEGAQRRQVQLGVVPPGVFLGHPDEAGAAVVGLELPLEVVLDRGEGGQESDRATDQDVPRRIDKRAWAYLSRVVQGTARRSAKWG